MSSYRSAMKAELEARLAAGDATFSHFSYEANELGALEEAFRSYGETGRARLTTLTKEFFMPRFLERDEAEREPPCELYPWDGVRNVRPFSRLQATVVEGVY